MTPCQDILQFLFSGLTSGSKLGGVGLWLVEFLPVGYPSGPYKDTLAFVPLLTVLLLRPSGLPGRRTTQKH